MRYLSTLVLFLGNDIQVKLICDPEPVNQRNTLSFLNNILLLANMMDLEFQV